MPLCVTLTHILTHHIVHSGCISAANRGPLSQAHAHTHRERNSRHALARYHSNVLFVTTLSKELQLNAWPKICKRKNFSKSNLNPRTESYSKFQVGKNSPNLQKQASLSGYKSYTDPKRKFYKYTHTLSLSQTDTHTDICAEPSDHHVYPEPHDADKDTVVTRVTDVQQKLFTSTSLTNLFCTFIWSN